MTEETFLGPAIPSILIVDDTLANLELLSGMLKDRGYEPRPVPSGKLALAAAQASPPDLVLLDIRMPDMDGFEVCKRLKADETLKDIPVLFISALAETSEKVKAFSLGAVDYVTKPFQFEEIEARVRTHLRIRLLQRQLHAQNESLEKIVVERTRQLADTNKQLVKSTRLKDDFLRMISYEIRTPANGVLGIGDLIIDLCSSSEEIAHYAGLFRESSTRLRNLIEDASLIVEMDKLSLKSGTAISFTVLLNDVRAALNTLQISLDELDMLESVFLLGNRTLLKRALETLIQLGMSFSRDMHTLHLTTMQEVGFLRVHINLNALPLSNAAAAGFFEIESLVRAESPAEGLGLAPIVAHRIITTMGGEMKLVKTEGSSGYLEATFLQAG
jgi:two-component system, sensor histidine kinase and response regulator